MTARAFFMSITAMLVVALFICGAVVNETRVALADVPVVEAQSGASSTVVLKSGTQYFLFTVVDGQPITSPVRVVDLGVDTTPVEPPTVPNNFATAVVAEVNKIAATDARHAAALKLSKTYEMLADQKIPVGKTVEAVNTIVKLALDADAATWSGVTSLVGVELGKCTTEAQADAVLTSAADAVVSTIPASGGLDAGDDDAMAAVAERYGLDWEKFLSFLMELLVKLLPLLIK